MGRTVIKVSVAPPRECLHREYTDDPDLAAKAKDIEWPPSVLEHKAFKESAGTSVPLALYVDAAEYATRGSVLVLVLCNLVSGTRHLACSMEKHISVAAGAVAGVVYVEAYHGPPEMEFRGFGPGKVPSQKARWCSVAPGRWTSAVAGQPAAVVGRCCGPGQRRLGRILAHLRISVVETFRISMHVLSRGPGFDVCFRRLERTRPPIRRTRLAWRSTK